MQFVIGFLCGGVETNFMTLIDVVDWKYDQGGENVFLLLEVVGIIKRITLFY